MVLKTDQLTPTNNPQSLLNATQFLMQMQLVSMQLQSLL